MRKSGDNRKDTIIKKEIFNSEIRDKYYIDFVIDDRPCVIRMWKKLVYLYLMQEIVMNFRLKEIIMKKYNNEQIEKERNWWINIFFGKKSIFGIIYRDMLLKGKRPLSKDIDELFSKANRANVKIIKDKNINKEYKEIIKSY